MKPSLVRARYDNPAKHSARALVCQHVALSKPETVLDLYGGGASSRALRRVLPEASITSCEIDQQLWPVLRDEAQEHRLVAHYGDFRSAVGKYDFINLDLCSQWCGEAREVLVAASKMLTEDGSLAVTLMRTREAPEIAADRWFLVPVSIERATGLRVTCVYPYQSGVPMWMFILERGRPRSFSNVFADFLREEVEEYGMLGGHGFDYSLTCRACGLPEHGPIRGNSKRARAQRCTCDSPRWNVVAEEPALPGESEVAA